MPLVIMTLSLVNIKRIFGGKSSSAVVNGASRKVEGKRGQSLENIECCLQFTF